MKSVLFLTILAITLAYVNAKIAITSPIASTTWAFGAQQNVAWTVQANDTGAQTLSLFYTKGVDPVKFQGGEPVASVEVADIKSGKATIDLTAVDKSKYPAASSYYFLRFGDALTGTYSSSFKITGGTCTTCKETPATPSTPTSPMGNSTIPRTTITRTLTSTVRATTAANTSDAFSYGMSTVFAVIAAAILVLF